MPNANIIHLRFSFYVWSCIKAAYFKADEKHNLTYTKITDEQKFNNTNIIDSGVN